MHDGPGPLPYTPVVRSVDSLYRTIGGPHMTRHGTDIERRAEWDNLRAQYLAPADQHPPKILDSLLDALATAP